MIVHGAPLQVFSKVGAVSLKSTVFRTSESTGSSRMNNWIAVKDIEGVFRTGYVAVA